MSKIEEAAREFIQNDPILKHGILEDEVPKLMADFATSQLFNQQAKTVRQKIAELTDKLERRDKHIIVLKKIKDALTQQRDELKEENRHLGTITINAQNNHAALLEVRKERDFWKIGSFDDKLKAVEKERDELRETYKKVKQNQLSLITRLEAEKQKNEKLEIIISKCKTHILEHTFYNITKDLNK
tara:strand:+ start:148 stop:705 length:558 start_codon:yes stop_codon:yes gene_type:complete